MIFSSGSTGEPKGVMLSHYNIVSHADAEQLEQMFGLGKADRLLGVLPFFHSFGFTGTLAMPAAVGVGVRIVDVNQPHSEIPLPLGEPGLLLVREPNVMVGYLGQPEKTAEVLIRVAAGVSPAVEPGVPPGGKDVAGEKRMESLKVAAGSNASPGGRMPPSTSGGTPDATQLWFVTGDVALVDEDGFVQITDRLSRFSKIGGEMVPHIKIEERLHELAGVTGQTFVVIGVPDEKKGERLVVLHTLAEKDLPTLLEKFAACDLPNLWKPKAEAFFRVENFPLLGTGKLDLRGVKEMAAKLAVAA